MAKSFLLPDLGEGLTEASVVQWLVGEGDEIAIDQPVVEVESAKAVVELPSPFAGTVTKLHGDVGATISLGEPVVSVETGDAGDDETSSDDGASGADAAMGDDVESAAARESGESGGASSSTGGGSGAVLVGYGTTTDTTRLVRPAGGRFHNRSARRGARSDETAEGAASTTAARESTAATSDVLDTERRSRVVSPLVRRLALDNGFDASHLTASAVDGVVRRDDVEAAIEQFRATPEPAQPAAPPTPAPDARGTTRIPITGLRAVIADRLERSRRDVPEATIWLEVDATNAVALRRQLRDETGERFSLAALIGRFAIAALRRYPVLNATIAPGGRELVQHDAVHLGIAAQTDRGLVVPVVGDASSLSLRGLRDAIDDVASHTDGAFSPERLTGGTFTLNNYGGFGVDGSAPILNHPEVAMLGIGRLMDKPWVVDGEIAVRTIVTLTLVFDHRACDGDVASGFLTTVARAVERPTTAFADL